MKGRYCSCSPNNKLLLRPPKLTAHGPSRKTRCVTASSIRHRKLSVGGSTLHGLTNLRPGGVRLVRRMQNQGFSPPFFPSFLLNWMGRGGGNKNGGSFGAGFSGDTPDGSPLGAMYTVGHARDDTSPRTNFFIFPFF